MSEKPEALRLADRMAEGTGLDTQWDAAKELRRLHAENERLREQIRDCDGTIEALQAAVARAAQRLEET